MGLPTLDTAGLDQTLVDDLRELLAAACADLAPQADVGRGVLGDLVLELTAALAAALEADVDAVRSRASLDAMLADPAATVDPAADAVLSNYGVTRRPAAKAAGSAAVVLTARQAAAVPAGTLFSSSGGLTFQTTKAFAARTSESQVVADTDRLLTPAGANWQFTVDVEAVATGPAGNLPAGAQLTMPRPPARFASAHVSSALTGGADAETNGELLARLAAGASVRSWGCPAALEGLLRAQLPTLAAVSCAGAGDAEQRRDKRGLIPVSGGGRADAWLITAPGGYEARAVTLTATLHSKVGAVGTWQVGVGRDDAPGFYEVERALLTSDALTATGFAVASDDRGYDLAGADYQPDVASATEAAYSRYQTAVVRFTDTVTDVTSLSPGATKDYVLLFRLLPEIDALQDWLGDPARRPLGSDVLVRAAVPVFCSCSFDLVLPAADPEPDLAAVRAAASAAAGREFSDRLSASALAAAVRAVVPRATCDNWALAGRLRKPSGVSLSLSGTQTLTYTPLPSDSVSARTTAFFLPADSVTVTVVRV